ncbi:Copper resistance protein D domain-containing protein OS=Stutzerimonas stutzeri OX=316 GN=CXK95_17130 PE=4 SV=1 [Stutzerimonas stutzeri]
MTPFASLYALHVLAAVLWVGGMFFAWMVLRPAAVAVLQAPERLRLWAEVFRRFVQWVWIAVAVLPISGIGMWHLRFGAMVSAPRYVHVMTGLYLVMLALFLRLVLLQLPALRRAIDDQDWPAGGAVLGKIRALVGLNLLLGMALIAIASARPVF